MKVSLIKRWKRKQIKLRRKYSVNVKKRFKRKRDFSGKFFILLSDTKRAAILQFINQKMCKALYAIVISRWAVKQISPKYILSKRRNRRLLRKVEVIVSEKFKNGFKRKVRKKPKQIPPIRIFSCMVCNHKFTNREQFQKHNHVTQNPDSSASDGELIIDDDVMLVPDDPCTSGSRNSHSQIELNLKADPYELIPDKFYCMMDNCGKSFDKEDELIIHIAMQHNSDSKIFPCKKCDERFARESALLAHQRLSHPVEIIAPLPILKTRRKPVQNKKSSPTAIRDAVNKSLEAAQIETIIFRRYDSEKSNFICRICSVNFEQRSHLDRHMSVLHVMKVYNCYKCHVPYTRGMQLLNHLKAAHLNQVNDPGYIGTIRDLESISVYRCAFCQYSSKDRFRVDDHLIDEHYDEFEKSECTEEDHASSPDSLEELALPETKKILKKNEDLLVEMATKIVMSAYDSKKRKPINDPSFKNRCVRCGRRFARKKALRNHACERITGIGENGSTPATSSVVTPKIRNNSQMINGFFQCVSCPQVFTDKEMYNKHLTISHPVPNQSKVTYGFYGSSI